MIVTGRSMSLVDAAREGKVRTLEASIVDCCKRWAMEHPDELVALDRQVKIQRAELFDKRGISADGHFMAKAEIPITLYHMMRKEVDPGWLDNPEIRNVFYKVFKVGNLNQTSETNR